jgi:adenylate cyclase
LARERVERRLAAILAADVAGYSRLMGEDEEGTHRRLKAHLRDMVDPKIKEHHGRTVKNTGDGMLVEFASVVDAVRCAVEIQRAMKDRDADIPDDQRIKFRIGINLGDVIVEPEDIFGDGVNIAARLEALAEPGGICISRVVRDQIRDKLPYVFDDMGEQSVKNIARPVRIYRLRLDEEAKADSVPKLSLPLPEKPSIAVLPFQNMSGDPEQEYFADGMVEEIITALCRIRWLFVIARNSSFTYKGQSVDVKRVGRELGVRYVLEGSVRKAGGRVRITAQLIEAETGAHLWADRFDGSLEDVFDLQDQVATAVAGVIEPALQAAEQRRASRRPTDDLTAYDLYLRGLSNYSVFAKAENLRALDLLEGAIARDPDYGPALALDAACRLHIDINVWTADLASNRRQAIAAARRALDVCEGDPGVLVNVAFVLAYFGEDIDAMLALVDRAVASNPSYARGWYLGGLIRLWAGDPDRAVADIEKSIRLNPRDRLGVQTFLIGTAHFFSHRFEQAIATLLLAAQEHPGWPSTYRFLASSYAHLGRFRDAEEAVARLREVTTAVMPTSVEQYRKPEYRELYLSGFRLALAAGKAT